MAFAGCQSQPAAVETLSDPDFQPFESSQEPSVIEEAAMDKALAIMSREQILSRIRSEYLEMPGLKLTCAQAQRLWAMDQQTCSEVLDSLTEDRFLRRRDDGTYARLVDGSVAFAPMRMAKAERSGALARVPPRVASHSS
jgi:hypothetical protein